jgi:hypothetical protein
MRTIEKCSLLPQSGLNFGVNLSQKLFSFASIAVTEEVSQIDSSSANKGQTQQ